jgi:hypothetical protein
MAKSFSHDIDVGAPVHIEGVGSGRVISASETHVTVRHANDRVVDHPIDRVETLYDEKRDGGTQPWKSTSEAKTSKKPFGDTMKALQAKNGIQVQSAASKFAGEPTRREAALQARQKHGTQWESMNPAQQRAAIGDAHRASLNEHAARSQTHGAGDPASHASGGEKQSAPPPSTHGASDPKPIKVKASRQNAFDKELNTSRKMDAMTSPSNMQGIDNETHRRMLDKHNADSAAREDAIARRHGFKRKSNGYGFEADSTSPVHAPAPKKMNKKALAAHRAAAVARAKKE